MLKKGDLLGLIGVRRVVEYILGSGSSISEDISSDTRFAALSVIDRALIAVILAQISLCNSNHIQLTM